MFPQRRKLPNPFPPPHTSSSEAKRRSKLSILALVLSVFVFGIFMYNENFKSIAEFPARSTPASNPGGDILRGSRHEALLPSDPAALRAAVDQGGGGDRGKKEEEEGEEEEEKARHNKTKNRAPKNIIEEALPASAQQERPQEDRVPVDDDVGMKIQGLVPEPDGFETQKTEELVSVPESCDLFDGTWVYDDVGHPVYREDECEFLTAQVTCMRNGRKDDGYQKWRWQPKDCSLPRFNARLFAERLRGKRLMFVGDSLNRNQWESMVCLVQSAAEPGKKSLVFDGSRRIFRLHDYNATVEFYWAPFIVESNSDDPNIHSILDRIIMPESIDKHAVHWEGVDYLIFNSYIWWMNTYKMKVLRGSFANGSTEYDEIERPETYGRVIRTWADWVNRKVDPTRTSVFFSTMSPLHIKSTDWNNPDGVKCAKETEPVLNTTAPLDVGVDWRVLAVATNVTRAMGTQVYFLNITKLSEYRKDAHTSVYTIRQGHMLTPEQKADPQTYADCIHWCLPGLPDTWNEFLYAWIMSSKTPEGGL